MLKKTKIVCSIGPASRDPKILKQLMLSGMNVARLNFSHGTQEQKLDEITLIRKLSKELDLPITIVADIQGPKLRLGSIEGIREIKKGEAIHLTLNPLDDELPIQFDLTPFVKKNHRIYLNDGLVELKITAIRGKVIQTVALNSGWVSSNKGVNIPDTLLKGRAFTEKDYSDIEFALEENLDYLSLSFIQTVNDLKLIRDKIKKAKSSIKIISKIEKPEALKNLEEIVKESDAIMVARGDLAIETNSAEVPIIQQKLLRLTRQYQKPIIIATQMLESMIENPRPTRAEASDVGNAVLDQVDAVMLSAESASGKYPLETVQTMTEIIQSVEQHPDYTNYIKINWEMMPDEVRSSNALVASAASLSYRIGAKALIVTTASGKTARRLASFRPNAPIIAVTHNEQVCAQLNLLWNVTPMVIHPSSDVEVFIKKIIQSIKDESWVKKGDNVVIVTGTIAGSSGNTDTIRVVKI